MAHDHHHHAGVSRKLLAATVLTSLFIILELIVGFTASSLALIGDALHNFTDVLALVIAFVAVRLERRPATHEKTYGYQRAGILAAFINAGSLVAFTAFLFVEAFNRFRHPQPVDSGLMLVVAAVAVIMNLAIGLALRHEGKHDINIRSAVVHQLGDALSAVGIIIAALLIRRTGSPLWDPAVSIVIGVMILWSSWGVLREAVNLLLEGTPAGIDPAAVAHSLEGITGVSGVHHVHIWALGPSSSALSCHLLVGDVPIRSTSSMLDQVTEMLQREYRIVHTTVQFEFARCADDDPYCIPWQR
ncbi:MAG TPA: cation diffusion facilitator family transporter [Thermoanaerobaculia bacterium]|jgi:cobalt-zinc-cadmium efflux system protein|nr:cation diffusion facilitator family transporter [Thermoanaerobaculia bacterium]